MNKIMIDNVLSSFENWKDFKSLKTSIPATWTDSDLIFDWHLTVQTNEVPDNDPWESFTTPQKHHLKKLHLSWGTPPASTEHWMSFSPTLTGELSTILDHFDYETMSHNALKLPPGRMLMWHFDTYATFVNRKNIDQTDALKIKRSAIMMQDWDFGQVIQIGNEMISHWKQGDVFTWESYTWHGTANFGKSDMIVLQLSYIDDRL